MTRTEFYGLLAGPPNPTFGTKNEHGAQSPVYSLLVSLKSLRNFGKHVAHNGLVVGSSPTGPTIPLSHLAALLRTALWRAEPKTGCGARPSGSLPLPLCVFWGGGGFAGCAEPTRDLFVNGRPDEAGVILALFQHRANPLLGAGNEPYQHGLMFVLRARHATPWTRYLCCRQV